MRKLQLVLAVALAWGITLTNFSAAAEKSPVTAGKKAKDSPVMTSPLPQKAIAPAGNLRVPGTGPVPEAGNLLDRNAVEQHNAARAAREAQQMQKLQEAQRALQPGYRAATPGSGPESGGRDGNRLREQAGEHSTHQQSGAVTFGDGKSGSRPPSGPVNRNTGPGDYRAGTQDRATGRRPGGFASQPSSPASGANIRGSGQASWGDKDGNGVRVLEREEISNGDGDRESSMVTQGPDGTITIIAESRGSDGTVARTVREVMPDGSVRSKDTVINSEGELVHRHVREQRPPASGGQGSDQTGQPGMHDAAVSGNRNCNWNPVWGRCMEQQKPSRNDMTAQPGRGENTASSAGSAARSRLGAEAVTNTGDAGYSASHGGRTGGGGPIDMRDPSRDPQGFGTPARSGFVPD